MSVCGDASALARTLPYGQRRVGEYVARILKGAAPSELPVERSDAWKLTVNLRAAAQVASSSRRPSSPGPTR